MSTDNTFVVHVRRNDGADSSHPATDEKDALSIAKARRTTANYMVCIEENEQRIHRWDRDQVEGSNRWKSVDPDDFETLGPLRVVRRSNG